MFKKKMSTGFERLRVARSNVLAAMLSASFARQQLQDCLAEQELPHKLFSELRADSDTMWLPGLKFDGRTLDEWTRINNTGPVPAERKGRYALYGLLAGGLGGVALSRFFRKDGEVTSILPTGAQDSPQHNEVLQRASDTLHAFMRFESVPSVGNNPETINALKTVLLQNINLKQELLESQELQRRTMESLLQTQMGCATSETQRKAQAFQHAQKLKEVSQQLIASRQELEEVVEQRSRAIQSCMRVNKQCLNLQSEKVKLEGFLATKSENLGQQLVDLQNVVQRLTSTHQDTTKQLRQKTQQDEEKRTKIDVLTETQGRLTTQLKQVALELVACRQDRLEIVQQRDRLSESGMRVNEQCLNLQSQKVQLKTTSAAQSEELTKQLAAMRTTNGNLTTANQQTEQLLRERTEAGERKEEDNKVLTATQGRLTTHLKQVALELMACRQDRLEIIQQRDRLSQSGMRVNKQCLILQSEKVICQEALSIKGTELQTQLAASKLQIGKLTADNKEREREIAHEKGQQDEQHRAQIDRLTETQGRLTTQLKQVALELVACRQDRLEILQQRDRLSESGMRVNKQCLILQSENVNDKQKSAARDLRCQKDSERWDKEKQDLTADKEAKGEAIRKKDEEEEKNKTKIGALTTIQGRLITQLKQVALELVACRQDRLEIIQQRERLSQSGMRVNKQCLILHSETIHKEKNLVASNLKYKTASETWRLEKAGLEEGTETIEGQLREKTEEDAQKKLKIDALTKTQGHLTTHLKQVALELVACRQDRLEIIQQRERLSQNGIRVNNQCLMLHSEQVKCQHNSEKTITEHQEKSRQWKIEEERLKRTEEDNKSVSELKIKALIATQGNLTTKLEQVSRDLIISRQGLAESAVQHDRLSQTCMHANKTFVARHFEKLALEKQMTTTQGKLAVQLKQVALKLMASQQDLSETIEQHNRLSQNCMRANKQCVTLDTKLQKVAQDKKKEQDRTQLQRVTPANQKRQEPGVTLEPDQAQKQKATQEQVNTLRASNQTFISTLSKIQPQNQERDFGSLLAILNAHTADGMQKEYADEYFKDITKANKDVSEIVRRYDANLRKLKKWNKPFEGALTTVLQRCGRSSVDLDMLNIAAAGVAGLGEDAQDNYKSAIDQAVLALQGVEMKAAQPPDENPPPAIEVEMQDLPPFTNAEQMMSPDDLFLRNIGQYITNPTGMYPLDINGRNAYEVSKSPLSYFGIDGKHRPSVRLLNHMSLIMWDMLQTYVHKPHTEAEPLPSQNVLCYLVGMYITNGKDNEALDRILDPKNHPMRNPELPILPMDPKQFFNGVINPPTYAILQDVMAAVHTFNLNRMPVCLLGSAIQDQLSQDGLQKFAEFEKCAKAARSSEETAACMPAFSLNLGGSDRNTIKEMFGIISGYKRSGEDAKEAKAKRPRMIQKDRRTHQFDRKAHPKPFSFPDVPHFAQGSDLIKGEEDGTRRPVNDQEPSFERQHSKSLLGTLVEQFQAAENQDARNQLGVQLQATYVQYLKELQEDLQTRAIPYRESLEEYQTMKKIGDLVRGNSGDLELERYIAALLETKMQQEIGRQ
jgi:hypothetical protein